MSPEVAERQQRALELRRDGHTYDQIADELGYSDRGGAFRAVQQALRRAVAPAAKQLRDREGQRLELLWHDAYELVQASSDVKAILACVRISESLRRLYGLDAPVKVQHSDHLDAEIERLVKLIAGNDAEPAETS